MADNRKIRRRIRVFTGNSIVDRNVEKTETCTDKSERDVQARWQRFVRQLVKNGSAIFGYEWPDGGEEDFEHEPDMERHRG